MAASDVYAHLRRCWYKPHHLNRIVARRRLEAENESRAARLQAMEVATPFGPNQWGGFEAAARLLECALPGDYQPLVALGRLIGRVTLPTNDDLITAEIGDGQQIYQHLAAGTSG